MDGGVFDCPHANQSLPRLIAVVVMFDPESDDGLAYRSEVRSFFRAAREGPQQDILETKEVFGIGGSGDDEAIVVRDPGYVVGLRSREPRA
jgi:hypothetical protein